jgi:hypothetical protein
MHARDEHARKGCQMGYRITFLVGLAVGYVLGTRAGRERYEQMVKTARKVAEHPAVQQAARTTGTKATELTKVAGQKASERMPKLTETAKSSAGKVRGQMSRKPGRNSDQTKPADVNGKRPTD